ncbi:MAG: hypothetical protein ABI426_08150 [Flavobacterium sp.]
MTATEVLKNANIYLGEETINGIPCSIGYIKKFKWSWFATQLNTFVIIGQVDSTIDKKVIDNFSRCCFQYAVKNNKGWPRGIQAGIASIAILQGNNIENSAIHFCENFSKKHWSAFEIPILFNINEKKAIRFTNKPLWGAIYILYFIKTIDSIINQLK